MNIIRFVLILILINFNLYSQDHHDWSYNRVIYEVNVRQYTSSGTFAEFETHLDRLKDLGVGILWFMPVHPIGVVNRLGTLGSYYSVKDYYGINPEFGSLDDFKALVDSAHSKGMYVLMDCVGNHTSWDNSLTITHPEWYITDGQGNFVPPPGTNWSDVIQLDHSQPGLRTYMMDAMKFWITEADVDGFRCDAISFMPLDFWESANVELKSLKPEIFMLAEDDGIEYQYAGFDMSYGWGYHGFGQGILNNIAAGTSTANALNSYVIQEGDNYLSSHYRMYFTSNHDENSWHGTVFEQFGDAAEIFAVLTSTFRSMPLIYSGEEAGLNQRLLFFDKDEIIWQQHPFADIYKTLFNLKKVNKALWNGDDGGQPQRINTNNQPAVYAFVREKDNSKVFGIFNLTSSEQTFTLLGSLYAGSYKNVFAGDSTYISENTIMTLTGWSYEVFEYGSGVNSVSNENVLPVEFFLSQNYPNPFNPNTVINYQLPVNGNVTLKVYDILGNEVVTLVNEEKPAGKYEVEFNSSENHWGMSSGIYFYQLKAGSFSQTKKMVLVK